MNPLKKMKLNTLRKKVQENKERREAGRAPEIHEEINSLFELAEFYVDNGFDKDLPHADILSCEAYRAAAILGNSEAQYRCGKYFLEMGKFWDEVRDSMLGCDLQNKYSDAYYEEAFFYLEEAETNGHALAKREHGMAFIHGWGVEADTQKGYQLVIESIDLEGSWDKATEIFQSLGLNSTEFFSMLGAMRKNK